MPRDNRAYTCTPKNAIHWTREDQAQVWLKYYFRIVIHDPGKFCQRWHDAEILPSLQDVTKEQILSLIARQEFRGTPLFVKAAAFIRQQNRCGFVGAWLDGCGSPSQRATWLKHEFQRENNPRPKVKRPVGRPLKLITIARARSTPLIQRAPK